MSAGRLFRILILIVGGSMLVTIFKSGAEFSLLPLEVKEYADGQAEQMMSSVFVALYVMGLFFAYVASLFLLYAYKNLGRKLFVLCLLGGLPLYVLQGNVAMDWIDSLLTDLVLLLEGALLAMAYLSPIRERFDPSTINVAEVFD